MSRTLTLFLIAISSTALQGQSPRVSAPISGISYEITADSSAVGRRQLGVVMTFQAAGTAPIVLALPAWSPGHYTLLWFARRVSQFAAQSNGVAARMAEARLPDVGDQTPCVRERCVFRSTIWLMPLIVRWRGPLPTSRSSTAPISFSILSAADSIGRLASRCEPSHRGELRREWIRRPAPTISWRGIITT